MKVPTITLSIATALLLLSPASASAKPGDVGGELKIATGTIELAQSGNKKQEKDTKNSNDEDKKKKKKKKEDEDKKKEEGDESSHNDEDDC